MRVDPQDQSIKIRGLSCDFPVGKISLSFKGVLGGDFREISGSGDDTACFKVRVNDLTLAEESTFPPSGISALSQIGCHRP